jgi:hypothetical protein
MSLEVRQLVLRASVQDDDEDEGDEESGSSSKKAAGCGGDEDDDACEDKEALKEEILAACRAMLREELRALRQR